MMAQDCAKSDARAYCKGLTLDSRISLFLKERFFDNTFIFRVIFFTV